jgi:hypothetical protein
VAVVPSLPSDAPGRSTGAVRVAMAVIRNSAGGGDGGVVGAGRPPAAPAGTNVGMGRNACENACTRCNGWGVVPAAVVWPGNGAWKGEGGDTGATGRRANGDVVADEGCDDGASVANKGGVLRSTGGNVGKAWYVADTSAAETGVSARGRSLANSGSTSDDGGSSSSPSSPNSCKSTCVARYLSKKAAASMAGTHSHDGRFFSKKGAGVAARVPAVGAGTPAVADPMAPPPPSAAAARENVLGRGAAPTPKPTVLFINQKSINEL